MRRIAAFLAAALLLGPALAGERPTASDLVRRLTPSRVMRDMGPRGVTVEGANTSTAAPSVDLEVNFEFNSARLTTDAALTLDQLGRALNNPALAPSRFRLAGHTDGVGGEESNQILSEQRAAAVKDYLISRHGIAAARLETQGFGKSRLLDPAHPEAAINRRVQVTNIGG